MIILTEAPETDAKTWATVEKIITVLQKKKKKDMLLNIRYYFSTIFLSVYLTHGKKKT